MGTHTVSKWARYFDLSTGCRGASGLSLVCALVPGFLHRKLRASPLMRESVVAVGSDVLAVLLSSGGGWSGADAERKFE
jgi:hypothetical protein